MGDRRTFITNEIVKYCQKLDLKGFVANHDGNISAKLDDVIFATPTAISKGNITHDLIITLDSSGNKTEGLGKVFSEIKLHLTAYRSRHEINAVVHAHPPFATARGLLNLPIKPAIPEAIVSIGDIIPVVTFAMPGAKENDSIITNALTKTDVFIMPGNGVLAVGDSVEQAYLRLELVEHIAKIDYYARSIGTPMALTNEDINNLLEKRAASGLGPKKTQNQPSESIKTIVLEEIKKALLENHP